MASKREAWNIQPIKKPTSPLTAEIKAEVAAKANDMIENVLKPKHVQPPPKDEMFNYIIDFGTKWYRHYFHIYSTYACPHPDAYEPTFESKFARMEYLGDGKFALYWRHHSKEWVGALDALTLDESIEAIQDDSLFMP